MPNQANHMTLPAQCDMPASVTDTLQCHLCPYSVGHRMEPETLCNHLVGHHKIQGGSLYNTPIGKAARDRKHVKHPVEISEVEGMYTSPCDNPLEIHCNPCNENFCKRTALAHFENFILHPGLRDSAEVINSWECVKDGWLLKNNRAFMMLYEHRCDNRIVPVGSAQPGTDDVRGIAIPAPVVRGAVGAKVKVVKVFAGLRKRTRDAIPVRGNSFAALAVSSVHDAIDLASDEVMHIHS
jgi:hypothetical protein